MIQLRKACKSPVKVETVHGILSDCFNRIVNSLPMQNVWQGNVQDDGDRRSIP